MHTSPNFHRICFNDNKTGLRSREFFPEILFRINKKEVTKLVFVYINGGLTII